MPFDALNETTLDNAHSLNRAFLGLATSEHPPERVPAELATSLSALTAVERERLSRAPFLLFSLGYDADRWRQARGQTDPDLFREPMAASEWQLVTATLAVVWALTQTNRYAARYLCGSGVGWCDYAAATPLPELMVAASTFGSLVEPRISEQSGLWRKLVVSASDKRQYVRRAARLSALQCVLTSRGNETYVPTARAACGRSDRALGVADTPGRNGNRR